MATLSVRIIERGHQRNYHHSKAMKFNDLWNVWTCPFFISTRERELSTLLKHVVSNNRSFWISFQADEVKTPLKNNAVEIPLKYFK